MSNGVFRLTPVPPGTRLTKGSNAGSWGRLKGARRQRRVLLPKRLVAMVKWYGAWRKEGGPSRSLLLHITGRQAQILDLAARDLSDKQIVDRLRLSIPTIRTQLQRFYKANGVHSRTGAVALWLGSRSNENSTVRLSRVCWQMAPWNGQP